MEPMIRSVASFSKYFDSIRRRTLHFIAAIPHDKFDWSPAVGEFTFGDLVRHLAAAELMFVNAVAFGRWTYAGHTASGPSEHDALLAQLAAAHQQAVATLSSLPDSILGEARPSLDGPEVKAWRLLMAMIEHEVHHRSQLAMYLTLIQVKPPHIYGLGVEDVIARATG